MKVEDILRQLAPWREAHKRLAWKPIVEEGDRGLTVSKFSGMPWLAEDESYPCCQNCGQPMPLFLQLNLASLPEELTGKFGDGLLQMFYCPGEECDSYEEFSNTKLVRLVQPAVGEEDDSSGLLRVQNFPSFPPKTIVGWNCLNDYPNCLESEELGLSYSYDSAPEGNEIVEIDCPLVGLDNAVLQLDAGESFVEAEEITEAEPGDKLAGYPYWVQGVEYPNCPECNRRMELVFQLDSNDNLPFMFGDVGCGHITQCPEHKDVLTFVWACG